MTLHEFQRRLNRFDLVEQTAEAIRTTKNVIPLLNKKQMFEGIRADGSEISPFYTPFTVETKKQKGQPYDRVTLRDTGDFQDAIKVEVRSREYEISSTDSKTNMLVEKYGEKIFGLGKSAREQYIPEYLFPALKVRVESLLGLKFI